MQYKAIAPTLGAASLLVLVITAVEKAAKRGYSVGDAGTAGTQRSDPSTRTGESFSPVAKATPPCGFTTQY
jgi:hypothetical protein